MLRLLMRIRIICLMRLFDKECRNFPSGTKSEYLFFEEAATASWSEEIYIVSEILDTTYPICYKLKDFADEPLKGTFYSQQLQPTSASIYRIDKILRKRTTKNGVKECLVKWTGWDPKFNSWEKESDVLVSGAELAHAHNSHAAT